MRHLHGIPDLGANEAAPFPSRDGLRVYRGVFRKAYFIPWDALTGLGVRIVSQQELDKLGASLFMGAALFTMPLLAPAALLLKREVRVPILAIHFVVDDIEIEAEFVGKDEKETRAMYSQIVKEHSRYKKRLSKPLPR